MLNFSREELRPDFDRLVTYAREGLTSLADDVYRINVVDYCDVDRWTSEVDRIFRIKPLVLALSSELREPGSYYAVTILDIPVVLTRDKQGQVRAFINACRHRGMQVVPDGARRASRLTCIYHAWTFGLDGRLIGLPEAASFGAIDRSCYGLTPLAVEERAGLIWVVLTPDVPMDLDSWLGDLGPELDKMGLDGFEIFERTVFDTANWKLAMEGYLENYHFASLHGKGLAAFLHGNLNYFNDMGYHCLQQSPLRGIEDFDPPADRDWRTSEFVQYAYHLFPNTQLAFATVPAVADPVYRVLMSQIFPTRTPGKSITVQRILTSRNVRDTDDEEEISTFAQITRNTVMQEDNPAVLAVQAALLSGGNRYFTIGTNELALQHLHRNVERCLE